MGPREVLIALIAVALAVMAYVLLSRAPTREGYLVYPYLDLDEPGARGSYYALSEARGSPGPTGRVSPGGYVY